MTSLLVSIVIYNKKISDLTILKKISEENTDIFIYNNSKLPQEVPTFENVNIYYEYDHICIYYSNFIFLEENMKRILCNKSKFFI